MFLQAALFTAFQGVLDATSPDLAGTTTWPCTVHDCYGVCQLTVVYFTSFIFLLGWPSFAGVSYYTWMIRFIANSQKSDVYSCNLVDNFSIVQTIWTSSSLSFLLNEESSEVGKQLPCSTWAFFHDSQFFRAQSCSQTGSASQHQGPFCQLTTCQGRCSFLLPKHHKQWSVVCD